MADIGNIKNFFVTWFDESDGYVTNADITEDILGITFTDSGSGKVNECILKLSGAFGNFITTNGSKTVIDEYDRFRVQCEDLSGNTYDRYFEFNPIIVPSQTKEEGTLLELNLIGTEYHTQRINFAGRFWFSNGFDVAQAIGESYNENRKSRQPELSQHQFGYDQVTGVGNGFPKFTVNHYEYGLSENTGYNRWMQMLDKFGGSVANGGVLDYFDVGFETPSVNAIEVALFSQGSRTIDLDDDVNIPTITQSLAVNIGSTEVGIAAATATHVAAWGAQTHGSLPTGRSKYVSGKLQFQFRPQWDDQIAYLKDSKIKYLDNKHYKALSDIVGTAPFPAPSTVPLVWEQIDMGDEFGDTIRYSEWTDNRVREWANCGADPTATTQLGEVITSTGACMFDCNLVVLDPTPEAKYFRTWVDFRLSDADSKDMLLFADRYAYSGVDNQFPVGTRVLVDGFSSDLNGDDSNGVPFANNISEWSGEEWIVKYRPTQTDVELDTMQCVILDEAQIYQYDAGTTSWSVKGGDLYTDCLHKYTKIESAESFDPTPAITNSTAHPDVTKDGSTFATNIFSSVKITYDVTDNFLTRLLAGSDDPLGEYFSGGAWIVWRIPFSRTNTGSGVTVGNLFGTDTPGVGVNNLQPSFLDAQNMTWTSRGTRGFNQTNSEDLGELQGISANITITSKFVTEDIDLDGINRIRVWMIDRYDNTVYFDIDVPFVNTSFPINVPFSSFKPYRGRRPRYFQLAGNPSLTELVPQEIENLSSFAKREIMMIGWQIQDFYDEFDRYAPDLIGDLQDFNIDNTSISKVFGSKITMTIDNFHFTKPLLAIASDPSSTRDLEARFRKRPHIITFDQLLNDVNTELEKEQFQLKEYQIETAGSNLFSLKFGDSFFFANDQLVNEQDDSTDPTAKKIKLVVRNIDYSLTSPGTGSGGFERTVSCVKRFV